MPSPTTVRYWLRNVEGFQPLYAQAREEQADKIFEEILEIADHTANDVIIGRDGQETLNHEWVARSRLRIDARKWMAGKLRPKVYGDKYEFEHSGDIGLRPIVMGERPEK